jgi:rhodanese-related sulfurtransferase
MQQLRPRELADWLGDPARQSPRLVDVREEWEIEMCSLPDSQHMPMQEIPGRLAELEADAPTVVICHHGVRSMQVAMFLERQGFSALYNLTGGVAAWADEVDPSMRRY